jgi:hypothetical protein
MPAKSKSQQRLFGLVRKCQKTGECDSPEIEKVAKSISSKDTKKYASTKHKGLPEKKKNKKAKTFKEWLEARDLSEVGTSCGSCGGGGTSTGDIASFKQPVFGGPLRTRKKSDEILNMKKK